MNFGSLFGGALQGGAQAGQQKLARDLELAEQQRQEQAMFDRQMAMQNDAQNFYAGQDQARFGREDMRNKLLDERYTQEQADKKSWQDYLIQQDMEGNALKLADWDNRMRNEMSAEEEKKRQLELSAIDRKIDLLDLGIRTAIAVGDQVEAKRLAQQMYQLTSQRSQINNVGSIQGPPMPPGFQPPVSTGESETPSFLGPSTSNANRFIQWLQNVDQRYQQSPYPKLFDRSGSSLPTSLLESAQFRPLSKSDFINETPPPGIPIDQLLRDAGQFVGKNIQDPFGRAIRGYSR